MELVADTNIVIAALIRAGDTRSLLLRPDLELSSPVRLPEELEKHREEMLAKSGLEPEAFEKAEKLVLSNIRIVQRAIYAPFDVRARNIAPDKDDAPFFALALALDCPLWSNEKRLKDQDAVEVYNTTELQQMLVP